MRVCLILFYFVTTTIVYFVSMQMGERGISIPLFEGGDDGYFYWMEANNVAQGLPWSHTSIYAGIVGNLMLYSGIYSPYVFRLFNILGFILLVYYSLDLVNLQYKGRLGLSQNQYSAKVILLSCFLCYLSLIMMVNLSIYRDIWIYALFAASVSYCIKIYRKRAIHNILLLVLSLFMLYGFRRYAALAVIISIVSYGCYSFLKKRGNPLITLGLVGILFCVYYTFFIDFRVPIVNLTAKNALQYRESVMIGGSQMGISLNQPNVFLFIIYYIYSFAGNLIGPLPWHIRGWSTLVVFFAETIPMLYILYSIYRDRKLISNVQKYLLVNAFVWMMMISLINDNVGAGTRLRLPAWIMLIIVFSTLKTQRLCKYSKLLQLC